MTVTLPSGTIVGMGTAPARRSGPPPVQRSFRRFWLDRQDPFQNAGWRIENYPGSFALRGQPGPQVVEEIQDRMVQQLVDGNLHGAEVDVVDFNDAGFPNEPARRFVVARTDTRRRTLVTVNAYVQAYGDHLYYVVRSYLLPPLSTWRLLRRMLIAAAAIWLVLVVAAVVGFRMAGDASYDSPPGSSIVLLPAAAFVLALAFRRVLGNLLAGDGVSTAFRKEFPTRFDQGTFDDDDVRAFLKTSLQLTLGSIVSVLEARGIQVDGLKSIVQNIQTTTNHFASGTFVGAVFGGTGNIATGKVGP